MLKWMQSVFCISCRSLNMSSKMITYLTQKEAIELDQQLFNECSFSVDQLMELAGLSVASVIHKCYPPSQGKNVLIVCGPGNNGGDGLIAARHLKLFGYNPKVWYVKQGKLPLYERLVQQLNTFYVPFVQEYPQEPIDIVVDALFGFSFKPPVRPDAQTVLEKLASLDQTTKLVSVDIPSGWNVENGPPMDGTPILKPHCLISLTAPKLCAKHFKGDQHWLGGRFVPNTISEKYSLFLPPFEQTEQCVKLN